MNGHLSPVDRCRRALAINAYHGERGVECWCRVLSYLKLAEHGLRGRDNPWRASS